MEITIFNGNITTISMVYHLVPLVMTNIAMENVMAHRNRWFTHL